MGSVKLICVEGPSKGKEFPLQGKLIFDVGTSAAADVAFDDVAAAALHCKIYREGKVFNIFDLSGQGFKVNGKSSVKSALDNGDVVKIGSQSFKFVTPFDLPEEEPAPKPPEPEDSTPRPRVELRSVKGNDAGKVFDITDRDMVIMGRGIATDITVWDIRVSRIHCRLERDPTAGTFTVADLSSSNGTYVNGKKVERRRLENGDYLKLGSSVLHYEHAGV